MNTDPLRRVDEVTERLHVATTKFSSGEIDQAQFSAELAELGKISKEISAATEATGVANAPKPIAPSRSPLDGMVAPSRALPGHATQPERAFDSEMDLVLAAASISNVDVHIPKPIYAGDSEYTLDLILGGGDLHRPTTRISLTFGRDNAIVQDKTRVTLS